MEKDFDGWNIQKKKIQTNPSQGFSFSEREIWWCSVGLNIGDEEDGKNELFERPVLVVRKFNKNIALVVPMTTVVKYNRFHHVVLYENMYYSLILSQIRLTSIKRFQRYIRKLSPYQFALVKAKLILLLG